MSEDTPNCSASRRSPLPASPPQVTRGVVTGGADGGQPDDSRTRGEENKRTRDQGSQTLDKYTELCESGYYISLGRVASSSKTLHLKRFHHADYALHLLLQRF
jgi:hypothetical protein